MKFIDWFAGIGGFRRGLELAGHECIGFCEYDNYAVASYTAMHLITKEQAHYLKSLPLKQRQKEILKEEYRNGEWYAKDITEVKGSEIPKADIWTGGFPCQDISLAGHRRGFKGERSSLFFQFVRLLKEQEEENKPEWIILENVKNLLSVNDGWDFAKVLSALGKAGYNVGWQVFNSKDYGVPQNRERVYIVGHLRGKRGRKIFPLKGTGGENSVPIKIMGHRKGYRRNTQVFDGNGITETLSTCSGGGREHHVSVPIKVIGNCSSSGHGGKNIHAIDGIVSTCLSRDARGPKQIAIPIALSKYEISDGLDIAHGQHSLGIGIEAPKYGDVIFVETEQGFTVYAIWYEKYKCYIAIRKLTPKECFRLQGWEDKYFNRAAYFNSNSQLYKQAGNGVTVSVVKAIGKILKGENDG